VIAAVIAFDRRHLAHVVLREVLGGDEALARGAGGRDRLRDRALVEAVPPALRDELQRFRELLLHEAVARLVRVTLVEEDRRRRGIVTKVAGCGRQQRDVARVEDEAFLRERDRGRDQRSAAARAVLLARVLETRDAARHADGEMSLGARALDDVPCAVEVHVRPSRRAAPFRGNR
jgi:hypothetical protein